MNCFLIDFENVKSSGLKGIEHLIESDDVYIFYSEYANTITFDVHHKINKSHANLKFFKSGIVAKNALDFQLISYLGYLIAQKKYKNYFVITGDRGFESAVSFWKDFFKQNKFNDLSINRFYNIQDALDKKSIPSKFYNKKLPPTIPTVETEIELRQLKATNVIVDNPSNNLDNNLNKDLNIKDVDTKPLKASTSDTVAKSSNEVKATNQEQTSSTSANDVQKSFNRQPVQQQRQATPLLEEKAKSSVDRQATNGNAKNSNNNANKKSSNNVSNKNQAEKSKEDKDKLKNKNNPVKNNNNKKTFNNSSQQQKKNSNTNKNTNNNNNSKKVQNSTAKTSKNVQNDANNKKVKNINDTLNTNNKSASAEKVSKVDTKSKGFVFGKVDLNDDTSIIENIQKKSPVALIEQTSKDNTSKKEPIIKTTDLVENIAPKKEVSKEKEKEKVTVPTETISEIKFKEVEIINSTETPTDKDKEVPTDTSKTKRKVGRPRVKSTTNKKEKPKNNKKFQEDIPNDKLNKMLDKISNISEFADYSKDDKVQICKIVAFSNSKQEGYQAFMSCFGKRKGVEIYKIVKQEFDALKNLYLNS